MIIFKKIFCANFINKFLCFLFGLLSYKSTKCYSLHNYRVTTGQTEKLFLTFPDFLLLLNWLFSKFSWLFSDLLLKFSWLKSIKLWILKVKHYFIKRYLLKQKHFDVKIILTNFCVHAINLSCITYLRKLNKIDKILNVKYKHTCYLKY